MKKKGGLKSKRRNSPGKEYRLRERQNVLKMERSMEERNLEKKKNGLGDKQSVRKDPTVAVIAA